MNVLEGPDVQSDLMYEVQMDRRPTPEQNHDPVTDFFIAETGMILRRFLILNIALPTALAFYYALARADVSGQTTVIKILIVYCLSGIPMYLFALAGSLFFRRILSPGWWRVVPFVGGLIAIALGYLYLNILGLLIESSPWLSGGLTARFAPFLPFKEYLFAGATLLLPMIWFLANFLYELVTRDFYFFLDHSTPSSIDNSPAMKAEYAPIGSSPALNGTGIVSKLSHETLNRLIAIEAQEHYVRVHVEDGPSELVLYRFGDAASELELLGKAIQVHRSYCVAPNAVKTIERLGRSQKIILSNGMEIPVSQTYKAIVSKIRY